MHGCIAGRHFHDRLRIGQSPEIFLVKLVLAGMEGGRQAPAVASSLGDNLHLVRTHLLEQKRLLGPSNDGAEAGERHGLVVDLHLAKIDQAVNKSAQSELFKVDF
jgi:hypothetical protein